MTSLKNMVTSSNKRPILLPEYLKIERELLEN